MLSAGTDERNASEHFFQKTELELELVFDFSNSTMASNLLTRYSVGKLHYSLFHPFIVRAESF